VEGVGIVVVALIALTFSHDFFFFFFFFFFFALWSMVVQDLFGREKYGVGKMVGNYHKQFTRKYKSSLTQLLNKALDSSM
jgi:hypothetical protein